MGIDRETPIPLHYQLRQEILREIEAGKLKPGDRIPTEAEYEQAYKLSRNTIRQAIGALVHEGILSRQKAKGTFVCRRKIQPSLQVLSGYSDDMAARGFTPSKRLLEIGYGVPDVHILEFLGLGESDTAMRIERLLLADEEPIGTNAAWVRPFVGLEAAREWFTAGGSLYRLYEEKTGRRVLAADETLEAANAGAALAKLLGIKPSAPIMVVERATRDEAGFPVEFVVMRYRADRYRYRTHLTR